MINICIGNRMINEWECNWEFIHVYTNFLKIACRAFRQVQFESLKFSNYSQLMYCKSLLLLDFSYKLN